MSSNETQHHIEFLIQAPDGPVWAHIWSFLSWTERQRASAVNQGWRNRHMAIAEDLAEKDFQALGARLDAKKKARLAAREASGDYEKKRLDLKLYDAVNILLIDLGSNQLAYCFNRPPDSIFYNWRQDIPTRATPRCSQMKNIQELLDQGASDTHFFADENVEYPFILGRELFDKALPNEGTPRIDHFLSILKKQENRLDEVHRNEEVFAWELVQEMAFSACPKWKLTGENEGTNLFHAVMANAVIVPYGREDQFQYFKDQFRGPTLESREKAFQTLCLFFRECRDLKQRLEYFTRSLADWIMYAEGWEDKEVEYGWETPHFRFQHEFFVKLFRRLAVLPEVKRLGDTVESANHPSWLIDLMAGYNTGRNFTPVYLLFLINFTDCVKQGQAVMDRFDWEVIVHRLMSLPLLKRQFHKKLHEDYLFREAIMRSSDINDETKRLLVEFYHRDANDLESIQWPEERWQA